MKLIEINKTLKKEYNKTIILMKYGNFYSCFYNDALVMNYTFDYKLHDNKLGFPINIINNIIKTLNQNNIDYLIYNNELDIKYNYFNNNKYDYYLKLSIEKNNINILIKELNNIIKNKLNKDINKYKTIIEFVNEL